MKPDVIFLAQYRYRHSAVTDREKFQNWLQKGCSGALEGCGCFDYHQEAAEDVGVDPEEDFGRCQEQPHLVSPSQEASVWEAQKDQPGDHEADEEEDQIPNWL